ncbi:MAG: hypothetical protein JXO72_04060 [Vicinamibacteria bacterium]|nr:hypothetical protein [Vicinamibacteria bacterium]
MIDGSRPRLLKKPWLRAFIVAAIGAPRLASPAARDVAQATPPILEGAAPIQGSIALSNGKALNYAYHFDHNALRDGVIAGDSLIALAWSGNLLRFNLSDLRLTAQAARPFRATSIAADGEGRVFAGFEDGKILAIDPVTLKVRPFGEMAGRILWVGTRSRRTGASVVVAVADMREKTVAWPGMAMDEHARLFRASKRSMRAILAAGVLPDGPTHRFNTFSIRDDFDDMAPNAFLADGAGRLWLGVDAGAFGGLCAFLDLQTGRLTLITERCPGISGFTAGADGRVLAYGGVRHMGAGSGVIARVDRGQWEVLREFTSAPVDEEPISHPGDMARRPNAGKIPVEPAGPIDALAASTDGRRHFVLSDHRLFEADMDLQRWSARLDLPIRWIPGRRYSIGSTSAVTTLFHAPNDHDSMTFPSGRDGFFRISGPSIQHLPMSGQLAVTPRAAIADIWTTPLGTILAADRRGFNENDDLLWRLRADLWEGLSLTPRRPSRITNPWDWREVRPLLADGEGVLAHFRARLISRGERLWVRLTGNGVEEWPHWDTVDPNEVFHAPDGTIFRAHQRSVLRWRDMRWHVAGFDRRAQRHGFRFPGAHGRKTIILGDPIPPWIFYDVEYGRLYWIWDGDGVLRLDNLRFIGATSDPGPVLDAVYEGAGMVSLATPRGAFRLNVATGQLDEIRSPEPPSRVRSLCRDGVGRLWLVGDRLHLSAASGQSWTSFDELPMVGPTETKRLRSNPDDPQGVILALHDRGVAFLTTR